MPNNLNVMSFEVYSQNTADICLACAGNKKYYIMIATYLFNIIIKFEMYEIIVRFSSYMYFASHQAISEEQNDILENSSLTFCENHNVDSCYTTL